MAHYAILDENNIVINVIKGTDETELIEGVLPEIWYANFTNKTVIRTSINHNIRKQYAWVGDTYDPINDVFIRPKPFPSWVLNDNFDWRAPVDMPSLGSDYTKMWVWNESSLNWDEDTSSPPPTITIKNLK